MDKLKKQQVGARIAGELAERFKKEMEQAGKTQTELLEQIINEHYEPKTEQQPGTSTEENIFIIDITKCSSTVIGAFLQVADRKKVDFYGALEMFVNYIERESNPVEKHYVELGESYKTKQN